MSEGLTVFILPYRSTGSGMTTYTNYLIKAISKTGVDVKVVGFGPPPNFIIQNGIPFFTIGEDPYKMDYLGGPAATYAWIRRKLKKLNYELENGDKVFHFVYPGANFVPQDSTSRTVVTAWGYSSKLDILNKSLLDFPLLKYPVVVLGKFQHFYLDLHSYSNADFVIGTTSETIEFWKKRLKSFNGKYIPLPVEGNSSTDVTPAKSKDKVNFLIGERDLERPRNNVWNVLRAFKILFDRGLTNFHIHLVGGHGKKMKATVDHLKSMGIAISLSEYLPKSSYVALLDECDVSIAARYIMDQGGYWPLEAMVHGNCTVASDLPAFRDFVIPGLNGLLVDPFSAFDISDKISVVLENRDVLLSLKKGALAHILEVHNLETVGKQYVNVYKEILNRG